ncbi:MAG: 30S ribosomal protein S14 [Pseudomonadota bacterium]|jgi:small subunit ribosomal protein S14|nr:30S ribosomal protein S14 [Alphaproteobacteria bacterium]
MAKSSSIEKNKNRTVLMKNQKMGRDTLKAIIYNKDLPLEDRIRATIKLSERPRNSSLTRIRNRCEISGRSRGYYRKFQMSRIALRELGNQGMIPGLTKSSW